MVASGGCWCSTSCRAVIPNKGAPAGRSSSAPGGPGAAAEFPAGMAGAVVPEA